MNNTTLSDKLRQHVDRIHNKLDYKAVLTAPFKLISTGIIIILMAACITMWGMINAVLLYETYAAATIPGTVSYFVVFLIAFFGMGYSVHLAVLDSFETTHST